MDTLKRTGVRLMNRRRFGAGSASLVLAGLAGLESGRALGDQTCDRAQFPDLLSRYKVRPPWQVAGVDYPVGHPCEQTLLDVATNPPPGTTYSGGTLTVREDNVVISRYDFTVDNGVALSCPSNNNLVISNCRFGGSNYLQRPPSTGIIDFRGSDLSVTNCVVDGSAGGGSCVMFLYPRSSSGSVTIENNWFRNFGSRVIELLGGVSLSYRHNLISNGGTGGPAVHMNFLEWDSSQSVIKSPDFSYNTVFQQRQSGSGEGPQWYSNGKSITFRNPNCCNNTIVTAGAGAMTYCFHGSGDGVTVEGTATVNDNYVDPTGAYGAFYPDTFKAKGWTGRGNVNLATGATITVT